ncbi:MAG: GntR family transcriptional regulator [Anaerolineae bacterium]
MTVDRNSPMPLYYQLKQLLLAKIESGELKAGDIFPTEQQIQDQYDVSRTTVRQSLSELEAEGKITRHRGRGTFVAKPKISHSPENYPNLADHMTMHGSQPGWKVLSADWVMPDDEIVRQLKLKEDQKVFCLERLRLENQEAIGYHLAYVAPQYTSFIDEKSYTEGGSLRYLSGLSTLSDCVADRTLEAIPATHKLVSLLDIAQVDPLLRVKRTVYAPERQPIEFFIGVYRGDRFQYHINNMRAISGINA